LVTPQKYILAYLLRLNLLSEYFAFRCMGFLLVCVGIQFVVDGTHQVLSSPKLMAPSWK
jgi:hypothetical protein